MELVSSFLKYGQSLFMLALTLFIFYTSGCTLVQLFINPLMNSRSGFVSYAIYRIFIGLVFYLKLAFITGLLGVFYWYLFAFVSALFVAFYFFLYHKKIALLEYSQEDKFCIVVLFVCSLLLGLRALHPLVGADDISYHLPYARAFLEQHAIVVQDHLIYPFQTLDVNLLYSLGLMLGDEYFLRLLSISFMALIAFLIFDYLRDRVNCWIALIAPLIIFASERIMELSLAIYVDFAYAFFATMAFVAFLKWKECVNREQATAFLVISALGVAQAASTKYFGLVCGFIVFLFFMAYSRSRIRDALVFSGICAALGTGWYIRNLILAGNPVHPFMSDVFGYYIWNEADLTLNLQELKSYGDSRSVSHYFKTMGKNTGVIFPLLVISVFISAWVKFRSQSTEKRQLAVLSLSAAGISLLFSLFWYFSAHVDRYLLPVIGVSCIAVALGFSLLFYGKKHSEVSYKALFISAVSGAVILISFYKNGIHFKAHPLDSQHAKLEIIAPGYRLMHFANTLDLKEDRIYQIGFATAAYYYKGVAAGHWMGKARWSAVADTRNWGLIMKPAKEISEYLKSNNYHALVFPGTSLTDRNDLLTEFNIVFEDNYGLVAVPKD